jgi:large subunit ribosomal protein L15
MARTGHGAMPSWFEGGQTPVHVRLPKLRGFKNPFRVEYEIVNVGLLSALAETGVLDVEEVVKDGAAKASKSVKPVPVTITPDILAAAGLVRTLDKPLKILGHGDVSRAMFVVADAFTKSAIAKIEAAGGTAHVLEFPTAGDGDELDLMPATLPPTSAATPSADEASADEASASDPEKGA